MASPPEPGDTTPSSRYHVERYGNTRNWALYDGGNLKAVVVYKKGGKSIQEELEARDGPAGAFEQKPTVLTFC